MNHRHKYRQVSFALLPIHHCYLLQASNIISSCLKFQTVYLDKMKYSVVTILLGATAVSNAAVLRRDVVADLGALLSNNGNGNSALNGNGVSLIEVGNMQH